MRRLPVYVSALGICGALAVAAFTLPLAAEAAQTLPERARATADLTNVRFVMTVSLVNRSDPLDGVRIKLTGAMATSGEWRSYGAIVSPLHPQHRGATLHFDVRLLPGALYVRPPTPEGMPAGRTWARVTRSQSSMPRSTLAGWCGK